MKDNKTTIIARCSLTGLCDLAVVETFLCPNLLNFTELGEGTSPGEGKLLSA